MAEATRVPSSLLSSASHSPGTATPQTPQSPAFEKEIYDLICIGFGPASLATAIAIHDTYPSHSRPRCLYLEKQSQFAWHSGMQIPGAKMQISFLKDLATPRQPTSSFTFLNYLQSVGRLHAFINLSTFLPSRKEFEAYLKWCAATIESEDRVLYGIEACSVQPSTAEHGEITSWQVSGRNDDHGEISWTTRNVVVALGGQPTIPKNMQDIRNIYHSSQYIHQISRMQNETHESSQLNFAVVGGGQSAAEIFNDLWDRYPGSEIRLIIKGSSLRPSDDSPL
jgi:L-ornithine N5-oxygenase